MIVGFERFVLSWGIVTFHINIQGIYVTLEAYTSNETLMLEFTKCNYPAW